MSPAAPTRVSIDQLKQRLAEFENAYELCQYIDHWPTALQCRDRNRAQIDRLKLEIERREAEG
jgi:uncharacterized protein YbgA (DUF1722 family)